MSKVIEVTDQNFEEEVLNSDLPTEVDFWAPWCGPCMMVSPIYDKLSEEYDGRFKFCKINVDENQRTAVKYQIMSIPMQKYFANGENVDEILGAVPEQTIRAMVEEVEHNQKHAEKFNKWAEKTENADSEPIIFNRALQAAKELKKANEQLSRVLMELQGNS